MLCGMFNVERDNCWKIWNDMPCAFVALDDGMDWKALRALFRKRGGKRGTAHGFSLTVTSLLLLS